MEKAQNRNSIFYTLLLWMSCVSLSFLIVPRVWKFIILDCILMAALLVVILLKRVEISKKEFAIDKFFYIALFLSIGLLIEFYDKWYESNIAGKVSEMLSISKKTITLVPSIILTLLSVFAIAWIIRCLVCNVFELKKDSFVQIKAFRKPFFILLAINVVALVAIIRSNYNYADDLDRISIGYKGWASVSRYLSNYFSNYLHANTYLTDISPFPQLLAVVLIVVAELVVLYVFTKKTEYSFWEYSAVFPLGLSPYFLERISYKYDAPYMALSVLAAVAPSVYFFERTNKKKLIVASALGTLGVCMTYQAALGIYPMLVIFVCALNAFRGDWQIKDVRNTILSSAAGYLAAMIVFKLLLMAPVDTYVSNAVPKITQIIPHTIENYSEYIRLIVTDFPWFWLVIIITIVLEYIVRSIIYGKSGICSVLVIAVSFLMMFGLYPVLEQPIFAPRAMYGVGAWLAFIALSSVAEFPDANGIEIARLSTFILSGMFFIFTFTYGNALYYQKEYTDYRKQEIGYELSSLMKDSNECKVQINGSIGYSPIVERSIDKYPVLGRLVRPQISEGWISIKEFYQYDNLLISNSDKNLEEQYLPVLVDTANYKISGENGWFLIELK